MNEFELKRKEEELEDKKKVLLQKGVCTESELRCMPTKDIETRYYNYLINKKATIEEKAKAFDTLVELLDLIVCEKPELDLRFWTLKYNLWHWSVDDDGERFQYTSKHEVGLSLDQYNNLKILEGRKPIDE